ILLPLFRGSHRIGRILLWMRPFSFVQLLIGHVLVTNGSARRHTPRHKKDPAGMSQQGPEPSSDVGHVWSHATAPWPSVSERPAGPWPRAASPEAGARRCPWSSRCWRGGAAPG